jgi:hypothetical protein
VRRSPVEWSEYARIRAADGGFAWLTLAERSRSAKSVHRIPFRSRASGPTFFCVACSGTTLNITGTPSIQSRHGWNQAPSETDDATATPELHSRLSPAFGPERSVPCPPRDWVVIDAEK